MFTSLAKNLDDKTLKDIHKLEQEIENPILAFSFYDLEPARLDEKQLAKIKRYEEGKCICLLAVKS
jgi:hypothetical protein